LRPSRAPSLRTSNPDRTHLPFIHGQAKLDQGSPGEEHDGSHANILTLVLDCYIPDLVETLISLITQSSVQSDPPRRRQDVDGVLLDLVLLQEDPEAHEGLSPLLLQFALLFPRLRSPPRRDGRILALIIIIIIIIIMYGSRHRLRRAPAAAAASDAGSELLSSGLQSRTKETAASLPREDKEAPGGACNGGVQPHVRSAVYARPSHLPRRGRDNSPNQKI